MLILSQGLTLSLIIVIGVISFKLNPLKIKVKTLVSVSFLVLLSVVLSIFSTMIPIFGFPALKIGLGQLPLMMIGFMFGPSWGFLAGLSADILELLSGTIAFPFLGFTLNKILVAVLPALSYKLLRHTRLKPLTIVTSLLAVVYVMAILYVLMVQGVRINDEFFTPSLAQRIVTSLVLMVLMMLMIGLMRRMDQQTSMSDAKSWVVGVVLVEILVQLILTPIWLNLMFGLPMVVSVSVRLIKAGLMVFIHGLIGLFLLRMMRFLNLNRT